MLAGGLAAASLLCVGIAYADTKDHAAQASIHYSDVSWTADYKDIAVVARSTQHIYVAEVVSSQTVHNLFGDGSEDEPATVYKLRVTKVLKGTVGREITVAQYGGQARNSTDVWLVQGDSLLQPGRQYLIASTFSSSLGLDVVLNTYGHTDLTAAGAQAQQKVTDMAAAVAATR